MSELVVFKANELAISRYDLTEHETKLILCCVALLNPTIENPTRKERTVSFTYNQYAQMMNISRENAYGVLAKATRELMTRTVEIRNTLVKGFEIFQWTNYAKFSSEKLELVFSEEILPYLFPVKKIHKI
uniref:replication initiation protein n=1 Tax=Escherichia coli TaxID=562 RepID=UPI0001660032|nr:replication initiation protein [Escherichia coli]